MCFAFLPCLVLRNNDANLFQKMVVAKGCFLKYLKAAGQP